MFHAVILILDAIETALNIQMTLMSFFFATDKNYEGYMTFISSRTVSRLAKNSVTVQLNL